MGTIEDHFGSELQWMGNADKVLLARELAVHIYDNFLENNPSPQARKGLENRNHRGGRRGSAA